MKKIILLIIILLTTGCADYRELSDMAMVSNIAISKEEDKYKFFNTFVRQSSAVGPFSENLILTNLPLTLNI